MARRSELKDPLGLSLLDVLSNALGGAILLLLIVAVTTKFANEQSKNKSTVADVGKVETIEFVKKGEPSKENFYIVELQFKRPRTIKDRENQNWIHTKQQQCDSLHWVFVQSLQNQGEDPSLNFNFDSLKLEDTCLIVVSKANMPIICERRILSSSDEVAFNGKASNPRLPGKKIK